MLRLLLVVVLYAVLLVVLLVRLLVVRYLLHARVHWLLRFLLGLGDRRLWFRLWCGHRRDSNFRSHGGARDTHRADYQFIVRSGSCGCGARAGSSVALAGTGGAQYS